VVSDRQTTVHIYPERRLARKPVGLVAAISANPQSVNQQVAAANAHPEINPEHYRGGNRVVAN
jgi:hypothetical protein